ncbi:MAG: glycosyltransferase family 2 protein [Verrucomicrobiota bacterium]|nr:glycosyltransferase family 2 protein [Verrucomicrobiota bacterium]
MVTPKIICLTPVRNEEWIIERFIRAASLWADLIILADQGSTDRTVAIASGHPKVRIIDNPHPAYDEFARQKLLINEARKAIPGPRLFLALDADEALTGNFAASLEWSEILQAKRGTVIYFKWFNVKPGCQQGWLSDKAYPWGFMDDGAEHSGTDIHSPRVPVRLNSPRINCEKIRVLHLQYIDPKRMESKHRWYQCYERIKNPKASAIKLFDQYHHMYRIKPEALVSPDQEWFQNYKRLGIDLCMPNAPENGVYWWDLLLFELIEKHGAKMFARENIWQDWPGLVQASGHTLDKFPDPRTAFQKKVHDFLNRPETFKNSFRVRLIKSCLKRLGW